VKSTNRCHTKSFIAVSPDARCAQKRATTVPENPTFDTPFQTAQHKKEKLGQITNTISISERPASVEDQAVPSHWEGDLIEDSNKSYIAILVSPFPGNPVQFSKC